MYLDLVAVVFGAIDAEVTVILVHQKVCRVFGYIGRVMQTTMRVRRQRRPLRIWPILLGLAFAFLSPVLLHASEDWSAWAKFAENPVLSGTLFLASDGTILEHDGEYLMYYTDVDLLTQELPTIINLARSADGLSWTIDSTVVDGNPGDWDEATESPAIWEDSSGLLHLYYSGYERFGVPADGFPADLGVATSGQALGFVKDPLNPLLLRTPGGHDNDAIYSPDIVAEGGLYYMVYAGHCYTACSDPPEGNVYLLGATSEDLVHWTKRDEVVLRNDPALEWMELYAAEPALVRGPNGKYYLFITGFDRHEKPSIGIAEGPTPFGPWDLRPEPILIRGASWDASWAGAPDVLIEDDRVRLWYTGWDAEGSAGRISYAFARWPLRAAAGGDADSDGDSHADAVDNCPQWKNPSQEDSDGDQSGDPCDCAPTDASSRRSPFETRALRLGPGETLSWEDMSPELGSSVRYDLLRGRVQDLPVAGDSAALCLASGLSSPLAEDGGTPLPGRAYYYLVRSTSPCGTGLFGIDGVGVERQNPVCGSGSESR